VQRNFHLSRSRFLKRHSIISLLSILSGSRYFMVVYHIIRGGHVIKQICPYCSCDMDIYGPQYINIHIDHGKRSQPRLLYKVWELVQLLRKTSKMRTCRSPATTSLIGKQTPNKIGIPISPEDPLERTPTFTDDGFYFILIFLLHFSTG
jgi:hypothetical protein